MYIASLRCIAERVIYTSFSGGFWSFFLGGGSVFTSHSSIRQSLKMSESDPLPSSSPIKLPLISILVHSADGIKGMIGVICLKMKFQ